MKYFEFTFHTSPCTETVNDVLAAVLGEAGFESFVESEGGLTAYIQQALCDENTIKNARTIENLHELIKNNGKSFELSDEEMQLAELLG